MLPDPHRKAVPQGSASNGDARPDAWDRPAAQGDAKARDDAKTIAGLEELVARRTRERDTAQGALHRMALDSAAVPNAEGDALSARLFAIAREMQRLSAELELRNVALATQNWRLEQRVAERTAALEAALDAKRESDDRFRRVADGVPQLVWSSHPEGRWDYANRRWQTYTGQAEKETHGLGWLESVHPDDRDRTMSAWHTAVRLKGRLFVEHRIRGANGSYRWFETQAMPDKDDGQAADSPGAQWVGSCSDIHARKLAENELRGINADLENELAHRRRELAGSEARFHAMFQTTPEFLFVVIAAPDRRFLHDAFNPAFERLTGFRSERARGKEAHAFMPAATAQTFEEHYRLCLDGGMPHVFDATLALAVGTRSLRVSLTPTLGSDEGGGSTRCLLGSVRDIGNAQDPYPPLSV